MRAFFWPKFHKFCAQTAKKCLLVHSFTSSDFDKIPVINLKLKFEDNLTIEQIYLFQCRIQVNNNVCTLWNFIRIVVMPTAEKVAKETSERFMMVPAKASVAHFLDSFFARSVVDFSLVRIR